MASATVHKEASKFLVFVAFACVYVIWGSTYLGISLAIKSIPPLLMVGSRFFVAGVLLLGWCLLHGERLPSLRDAGKISLGGIFMLFVGNGAVSYSEQYLPTGLAAIIPATVPIWFVLLDRRQWAFHFSNKMIVVGCLIGFGGVLLLFSGKGSVDLAHNHMQLISFFALICGSIGWATGSLISKYQSVNCSVTVKAAVQMVVAGLVSILAGVVAGELPDLHMGAITVQALCAWLYLIFFGSLVGYMAYIWLLSVRPPSLVGTYAYVNPIVAVFLGWLLLHEQIGRGQVLALLVILSGVILVNLTRDRKVAKPAAPAVKTILAE